MSVLKSLRVLARYNVLTPVALIAVALPGAAYATDFDFPIGSTPAPVTLVNGDTLKNAGTIDGGGGTAVSASGTVTSILNSVTGKITGDKGVFTSGTISSFINRGEMSTADRAVSGVTITDFVNSGLISSDYFVIEYTNGVNFTNEKGGRITGQNGPKIDAFTGIFDNAGTIIATDFEALRLGDHGSGGNPTIFRNSGTIQSLNGDAVQIDSSPGQFLNLAGGQLLGTGNGVLIDDGVSLFSNAGLIVGTSGTGARFGGDVTTFNNLAGGTISGARGVEIDGAATTFGNEGAITGTNGSGASFGGLVSTFTNSGELKGGSNGDDALNFGGGVTNFTNDTGGLIQSTLNNTSGGGAAIGINTDTGNSGAVLNSFINRGKIYGGDASDNSHVNGNDNQAATINFGGNNPTKVVAFQNFGEIWGVGTGVNLQGGAASFRNEAGGSITSTKYDAVNANGQLDAFFNAGLVSGAGDNVVNLNRGVTSFENDTTGTIINSTALEVKAGGFGGGAININTDTGSGSAVSSFVNRGNIFGASNQAGQYRDTINFYRDDSGQNGATNIAHVLGNFLNSGTISGPGTAVAFNGTVTNFTNTKTIAGGGYQVLNFNGGVTNFLNDVGATITNTNGNNVNNPTHQGGIAVAINIGTTTGVATASFINRGTITGAANATWSLPSVAFYFDSNNDTDGHAVGLFNNAGTINGPGTGVYFGAGVTNFTNSGSIVSADDVAVFADGNNANSLINSGTLSGKTKAVVLGGGDDKLTIQTGSKIFGSLNFEGGTDTLDFAGFIGNTVLDVTSLNALVPGTAPYFDTRDVNGDGKIAIVDIAGLNNQTIGQSLLDMLLGSNELISGQMLDASGADAVPTQFAPTLRTPALDAVDTAVLTEMDTVQKMGTKVWGGFVGGGSAKATPIDQSAVYGGIVFGAHAQLDPTFKLGGTAGYVMTTSTRQGGTQALATQTGLLGVYGQASLGVADIDVSLLAGGSAHTSTRQVIANNTTETATGIFNSMFLAPSIGVTIPVLDNEMGELLVKTSATYVGGTTTAYTETGSSMNLAVGAQTISVFDARIGLEGRKAIDIGDGVTADIVARAGILVQGNGGSASVPVTAFGQTINVATPGTSALGVYGGVGLDAQLTDTLNLNMSVDGALRTDGLNSLAVKGTLGGTF